MAEERTQRRLAAILAADVVGYSRLIGTDEEGTLAALKAHWRELTDPKVEQHHGRVVKTTGDGALIEFASVVDAVRFAVDVQRGTVERNVGVPPDKRIEFRIGINVGDIVIDGDDILGDGVNIAARLEGLAEPGGVLVSRAVRDQVRDRLELAFEDLGEREFKNIARPVRVYRVRLDEVATRRSAAVKRSHIWKWTIAAGAAVVLMASATLWSFYSREPSAPSPSVTSQPTIIAAAPSIAVLPFANMSGDPALDYFADGVTDTMIAGLSRSPAIRVVARTSTAVYKGKAIDVRQISKELGVRYVLEGSVQKGTDELRIVAQLIDGGTGDHVWGERYDREGTDALALQDEVVEKVIGTLAGNHGLIRKKEYEQSWGKDRASLEEYDYYLRGHHLWDRFTREDTHEAIAVWQQGLDRFPDSSLLRIKLGWGYFQLAFGGWSTDFAGDVQRAFELAEQGLAGKNLAPIGKYSGHSLMAWLQIYHKNDWDQALREREIVLALNPNDPVAISTMAELSIQAGRPDEAIASLRRDIAWDSTSLMSTPHFRLGMAYFMKGAYPTALEHLKREPNLDPLYTLTFLAATYAELGQIDEARATVARILKAKPEASLTLIRTSWPFRDEADTERLIGALRKAGLPDP